MINRITNYLRTAWIFCISLAIFARPVFFSIFRLPFVKLEERRACADGFIKEFSERITQVVKIHHKVTYQTPFEWRDDTRYMILSNHNSLYDIPLIYLALPHSIRMVSKKELRRIPFFGTAMINAEFIFIDRQHIAQAVIDLETARHKLETGIKLWMAPEGTRSRTGKLLPFKKGPFILALQTNAVIIPVGIKGAKEVLPPKTFRFNLNQNVEIVIGAPIDTREYTMETKELLIERVRHTIATLADEALETR